VTNTLAFYNIKLIQAKFYDTDTRRFGLIYVLLL